MADLAESVTARNLYATKLSGKEKQHEDVTVTGPSAYYLVFKFISEHVQHSESGRLEVGTWKCQNWTEFLNEKSRT